MKILTVVLIGAGSRGIIYTDLMAEMKDRYKVVAVADPIEARRNYVRDRHGLADNRCFRDWKDLLRLGKIADVALICTMDRQHFQPVVTAIGLHYDILLEKPVSSDPRECMQIAELAEQEKVKIVVCHVLRYAPFFMTIKDLIDQGRLGRIVSVNHEECVGNVHQSHSFVRGNWGNSRRSSCMLLQKSCHDLDILQWLIGSRCRKIQSFGFLSQFQEGQAPEGAPEYCIDGCPEGENCPYNAVKLYLDDKKNRWFRDTCTQKVDPTDEEVIEALRTTQYGKCVYRCDNDVVDHQTVNILFDGETTVTFTMCAFTKGGRSIHIMGTKGELNGSMDSEAPISLYSFETGKTEYIPFTGKDGIQNGHGGGDRNILLNLYELLANGRKSKSISDIITSVYNHLMVFAAEKSRQDGNVVDFDQYLETLRKQK